MESEKSSRIENLTSSIVNGSKTLADNVKSVADSAGTKWKESSTLKKVFIVSVPAGLTAPLLIIPTLSAAGFTPAGVAAGSIAASLQTPATVSGSIFALCQSAGATGVVAVPTYLATGLTTGLTTGGVTAAIVNKESNDSGSNDKKTVQMENYKLLSRL